MRSYPALSCWIVLSMLELPQHAHAFAGSRIASQRSPPTRLWGSDGLDRGFNLLETASKIIPQGQIVGTVKETWKFAWKRMMAELAPQDKTGTYRRPAYTFGEKIGSPSFPDEPGRYVRFLAQHFLGAQWLFSPFVISFFLPCSSCSPLCNTFLSQLSFVCR